MTPASALVLSFTGLTLAVLGDLQEHLGYPTPGRASVVTLVNVPSAEYVQPGLAYGAYVGTALLAVQVLVAGSLVVERRRSTRTA